MDAQPFDQALGLQPLSEGVWQAHTHSVYANMVGPFGGITAAQALQAVLVHPHRLGEPISLTVNYCAAIADGIFEVHARPARSKRHTALADRAMTNRLNGDYGHCRHCGAARYLGCRRRAHALLP